MPWLPREMQKGTIILRGTGDPVYFSFLPSFKRAFSLSWYKQTKKQLGIFIQFRSIAFVIKKLTAGPGLGRVEGGGRGRRRVPRESCLLPGARSVSKLFGFDPVRSTALRRMQVLIWYHSLHSLTGWQTLVPPKRSGFGWWGTSGVG